MKPRSNGNLNNIHDHFQGHGISSNAIIIPSCECEASAEKTSSAVHVNGVRSALTLKHTTAISAGI